MIRRSIEKDYEHAEVPGTPEYQAALDRLTKSAMIWHEITLPDGRIVFTGHISCHDCELCETQGPVNHLYSEGKTWPKADWKAEYHDCCDSFEERWPVQVALFALFRSDNELPPDAQVALLRTPLGDWLVHAHGVPSSSFCGSGSKSACRHIPALDGVTDGEEAAKIILGNIRPGDMRADRPGHFGLRREG